MNNMDLFLECLKNPEPIFDTLYFTDDKIVTPDKNQPNILMQANSDLKDIFTTLYNLQSNGDLTDEIFK